MTRLAAKTTDGPAGFAAFEQIYPPVQNAPLEPHRGSLSGVNRILQIHHLAITHYDPLIEAL